jgi:hypothetical protein
MEIALYDMTLPDLRIPATGHDEAGAEGIRAIAPLGQPQRLESSPASFKDLLHTARQMRRVRTNPASYSQGSLDMPLIEYFTD